MAEYSPMMTKYLETKEAYPDCILFYRLGDFYEMFFEDAITASRELQLTLTGKACGKEEKAPMCGVPFHAVDTYLDKLVEKGYKVAICEQVEDPKAAKGLVKREVTRIVTPGTNFSTSSLDDKKNNYICSIYAAKGRFGLAVSDVSTGYFAFTELESPRKLTDEVIRFAPAELLCNSDFRKVYGKNEEEIQLKLGITATMLADRYFKKDNCIDVLKGHFHIASLAGIGMTDFDHGTIASGSLLSYLLETQMNDLAHISEIHPYEIGSYMFLDSATRRNLELTETMREKRTTGSLLWVLDKTKTAMGGRLLRSYISQPLIHADEICKRQDAVESFLRNMISREELREYLNSVYDLERLIGRITYRSANPRDLNAFASSLQYLPSILELLQEFDGELIRKIEKELDPLEDLYSLIDSAIVEDAPISLHEGGIIKEGYLEAIDEYRHASTEGKSWLAQIEAEEREKTGIKNLRIKYNKVFGYYLEVTNSFLNLVPDYFIRKQTLTNAERFITPELKELEDKILGAQDKLTALEYDTFNKILDQISDQVERIQKTANALAQLDVFISLAIVAEKNRYCRPQVVEEDILKIKNGRHPVVEKTMQHELFIDNDTFFEENQRIALITGPNMAGKSTYMRQVALIVLMAQIGSFIPASSATIGVVDRIFTRVGASDDLASGQSTFMLEMNEVANILRNATNRSLIILDEIGRGTSTYDGLSIAWAVAEYISTNPSVCAKTLFATHYHELTQLEDILDNVKNYNIAVRESGDDIVFLRKINPGGADRSYGIQVAKLAGVPDAVINRAKVILSHISEEKDQEIRIDPNESLPEPEEETREEEALSFAEFSVIDKLKNLETDKMTPLEAMNLLYELQKMLN